MTPARRLFIVAVPALLAVSGCLATKGDIRLMQDEFRSSRTALTASEMAQKAHADSIAKAAATDAARTAARNDAMIRGLSDSLRLLRVQFGGQLSFLETTVRALRDSLKDQGLLVAQTRFLIQDLSTSGRSLATKVEQLQQAIARGDSLQAKLDRLMAGSPAGTGLDSTAAPVGAGQELPGPNTLREEGVKSLARAAPSAARRSFQLLVDSFPKDPMVPEVYLYIGRSYSDEGNSSKADSVYQLIVKQFPKDVVAGSALYKRGLIVESKNPALARQLYQKVVSDYPNSETYRLACDKLNKKGC